MWVLEIDSILSLSSKHLYLLGHLMRLLRVDTSCYMGNGK